MQNDQWILDDQDGVSVSWWWELLPMLRNGYAELLRDIGVIGNEVVFFEWIAS